jgi:hypothetical protein
LPSPTRARTCSRRPSRSRYSSSLWWKRFY